MDPHSKSTHREVPTDLRALAVLLDSKFEGPFGFRFGWDALLGLIPGIGAVIPALVSLYIVVRAIVLRVSFITVLHMIVNVLIDTALSLIPIAGQITDFFWKSNLKNIELMERSFIDERRSVRSSVMFLGAITGGWFSLVLLLIYIIYWIGSGVLRLLMAPF